MKISFSKSPNSNIDLLLCPVFKNDKALNNYEQNIKKTYFDLYNKKLISGEKGENETVTPNEKNLPGKICFIGFGEKAKLENYEPRELIGGRIKSMMKKNNKKIGLYISRELEKYISELVEGALLVNFTPVKFKTGKDDQKAKESLFDELIIVTSSESKLKNIVNEALITTQAVNEVRDLVNGPPNFINVSMFAEKAKIFLPQISTDSHRLILG